MRIAGIGVVKVVSHLEAAGTFAMANQLAYVCDIIGNNSADEAFMVCLRLECTQARVWELSHDSPIYESTHDLEIIET